MQDSTSARSLITQLASLVNHLEKISSGPFEEKDIELLGAVNDILRECILSQKRIKLQKANQNMLGEVESYISDSEHQRLKAVLDNLKPNINVLQHRVARLIGDMNPDGTISASAVKNNILYIFDTLKNKIGNDAQEVAEIQVMSLQSVEAVCEVVRRLIIQESSKVQRR